MESGPLEKAEVQMIVKGHLGMYLAQDSMSPTEEGGAGLEMPDKSAQLDTKPRIEEAAKDHPDGLEPSALEADLSGEGEADLQLKQERPSTPEDPP